MPDQEQVPEDLGFRLDKSVITHRTFEEAEADDIEYWQSRTPAERLRAAEFLRRLNYGVDACTARLQRVITVVERGED